jgi:hypothetical protein
MLQIDPYTQSLLILPPPFHIKENSHYIMRLISTKPICFVIECLFYLWNVCQKFHLVSWMENHQCVSTEATNGFPGWSLRVVVSWKFEFLQGHLQSTATGIC